MKKINIVFTIIVFAMAVMFTSSAFARQNYEKVGLDERYPIPTFPQNYVNDQVDDDLFVPATLPKDDEAVAAMGMPDWTNTYIQIPREVITNYRPIPMKQQMEEFRKNR